MVKALDYTSYFTQCAQLAHPEIRYPALEGMHVKDLLVPNPNLLVRLVIDPLEPLDTSLITRHGIRAFEWKLTTEPSAWMSKVSVCLEQLAALGSQRAFHVIHMRSFFREPKQCRAFCEVLAVSKAHRALYQNLAYVMHPFEEDSTFDNKVLALFAEWPKRPAFLHDAKGCDELYLSRLLEWGYAGLTLAAAEDFDRAVCDRAYLNARKDREPIGKYIMDGGLLPSETEAMRKEAAAQSILGNRSVAWDGGEAAAPYISEGVIAF
ncbi:MAG: hypothetical protein AAGA45_07975 [Verrucomicrobiota bacterium]